MPQRVSHSGGDGASPDSSVASALDTDGGRYRLEERIGGGGSAEVWRATDLIDRRVVALKLLHAPLGEQPRAVAVLEHEAALLSQLGHPHIVRSHGLVRLGGRPALALEHLSGGDLVSLAGGPPARWLRAARELVSALTYLHARGFVHRDVKSRNVLFDADDRARLIDFASAVTIGAPRPRGGGTAAYRPGLSEGGPATEEDDVVAVAVLLHELATGRLPDGSGRTAGRARVSWRRDPLAGVLDLVRETLAPRPGERRRGLSAFADVIESAIAASR
jgi:serine/threonine-protein kinase